MGGHPIGYPTPAFTPWLDLGLLVCSPSLGRCLQAAQLRVETQGPESRVVSRVFLPLDLVRAVVRFQLAHGERCTLIEDRMRSPFA